MPAVGILAPQILWIADYACNFVCIPLTGMIDDMFDGARPLNFRGLAPVHGWLQFLLVFMVVTVKVCAYEEILAAENRRTHGSAYGRRSNAVGCGQNALKPRLHCADGLGRIC